MDRVEGISSNLGACCDGHCSAVAGAIEEATLRRPPRELVNERMFLY